MGSWEEYGAPHSFGGPPFSKREKAAIILTVAAIIAGILYIFAF